jgi:hypothetical protein
LDLHLQDFATCTFLPQFTLTLQYKLHRFFQVFLYLRNRPPLTEGAGNGIYPSDVPFVTLLEPEQLLTCSIF